MIKKLGMILLVILSSMITHADIIAEPSAVVKDKSPTTIIIAGTVILIIIISSIIMIRKMKRNKQ